MSDASSTAYLRPETAQGIFVNFKNVQQTARTKVPFGIAQIGTCASTRVRERRLMSHVHTCVDKSFFFSHARTSARGTGA